MTTKFTLVCLRREDYYAFRKLSPGDLPGTFDEWADGIRKQEAELAARGVKVERVTIGVQEFSDWCARTGMKPDAVGREAFAVKKLRALVA